MQKWAKAVFSTVLLAFGGFLIFYAYYTWIRHYEVKFLGLWPIPLDQLLPLYHVDGLISFAIGLIITYKALKAETQKLPGSIISAILIITGSFLTYDIHKLSVGYHQTKGFLEKHSVPSLAYEDFVGLLTAYQWMPLYIAVAVASIIAGLIIAYKIFKTPRIHPHKDTQNSSS